MKSTRLLCLVPVQNQIIDLADGDTIEAEPLNTTAVNHSNFYDHAETEADQQTLQTGGPLCISNRQRAPQVALRSSDCALNLSRGEGVAFKDDRMP